MIESYNRILLQLHSKIPKNSGRGFVDNIMEDLLNSGLKKLTTSLSHLLAINAVNAVKWTISKELHFLAVSS